MVRAEAAVDVVVGNGLHTTVGSTADGPSPSDAAGIEVGATGKQIMVPEEHLVETKEVVEEDEEPAGFVQVPRILVREELRPPRRGRRRGGSAIAGSAGLDGSALPLGAKLRQEIDGVLGVTDAGEGGGGVPAVELAENRGPSGVGVRPIIALQALQLNA